MTELVVDDAFAQAVSSATGPVSLRDRQGQHVGYVVASIFSPEEIVAAQRRAGSSGPWRTTPEVLARLRSAEAQ